MPQACWGCGTGRSVDGDKQILTMVLVGYLWQIFDIDMHIAWVIIFLLFGDDQKMSNLQGVQLGGWPKYRR